MNLKGNNAEKFATTLIIFFVLFLAYILICIIFQTMIGSSLESMIKDGMGFAVTAITPVVAILLFSDWKEQHKLMKNEENIEKILIDLHHVDRKIKKFLNTALSLGADTIEFENLIPLKSEIAQCSYDITSIFLQLSIFEFKVDDQEFNNVCSKFLTEISFVLNQCRFGLECYEKTLNINDDDVFDQASLSASKTLLMDSVKTYWDKSKEKIEKISELSGKYTIKP